MNSKPIKRPQSENNTTTKLKQKNRKLQIQLDGLKNKVLKLENKTLKQEQKIIKLQTENTKLKEEKRPVSVNFIGLHDEPPKK